MAKPSKAMTQALRLQHLAMTSAETLAADLQTTADKELRAKQSQALSSIIKAFDTLEDRKRILRGKPMPGSLRPEQKQSRKTKHAHGLRVIELSEQENVALPSKESLLPQPPTEPTTGEGNVAGGA